MWGLEMLDTTRKDCRFDLPGRLILLCLVLRQRPVLAEALSILHIQMYKRIEVHMHEGIHI